MSATRFKDVPQGAFGALFEVFKNECRVKPSETATAQTEELAPISWDLMAGGVKFDLGSSAFAHG